MLLMGYLWPPFLPSPPASSVCASGPPAPSRLTASTASTARPAKKSAFMPPMILEDMAVLAADSRKSLQG